MFFKSLPQILSSRRGASAIEYALIASLIAVAAIGGMKALGTKQGEKWNQVDTRL